MSYEVALRLSALGFSVIPIRPRDKKPLIEWGEFQKRRATDEEIRSWYARWPDAGIGIVTGAISGLVVLDADGAQGLETIRLLVADGADFPHTVRAITPGKGGGSHVCYKHPGYPVQNRAHDIPGLIACDVRGDGGYIVAAPSVHPEGGVYAWAPGCAPWEVELAEMPSWLVEALKKPKPVPELAPVTTLDLDQVLQGIPHGRRDALVYRYACRLRGKGLSREEAQILVLKAASLCRDDKGGPPGSDPFPPEEALVKLDQAWKCPDPEDYIPADVPLPLIFASPLSELMAQEEKPIDYLAHLLLERGTIGFIGAEPKVGKSLIALHSALALAAGTPVLGKFPVSRRYRVLFIEEEDGEDMVRRRVRWLCKGHNVPIPEDAYFRQAIRKGFRIDDPRWLEKLSEELGGFQPELVVVDVLNKVHKADENAAKEMTPVMHRFEGLRRKFGCGFLICHHFGKQGKDGPSRGNQRMRGSTVLGGWSECSLYLTQLPGGIIRVEHESKNPTLKPFMVRIQGETDEQGEPTSLQLVHLGDAAAQKAERQKDTMKHLTEAYADGVPENCTVKAMAKRMGCSANTARNRLTALLDEGTAVLKTVQEGGRNVKAYVPMDPLHAQEWRKD